MKKILSDIEYNDHVVLIAHLDGEQIFHAAHKTGSADKFTETSKIFKSTCKGYKDYLIRNYDDYRAANGIHLDPEGNKKFEFDDYLYNPTNFITFGNADNLSIVAMDDFDVAIELTSHLKIPVRQTCLAFAPVLSNLGIDEESNISCEISDICSPNKTQGFDLSEYPLIAVSYYKLEALALLGSGLQLQQSIYSAMSHKIKEILRDLKSHVADGLYTDIIQPSTPNGVNADIDSFRICILDPQGWSDIVTLTFCRNYSVLATVIAGLRSLTFNDLYKTPSGPALKRAVEKYGLHKKIAAFSEKYDHRIKIKHDPHLGNNHIFCANHTTLGMAEDTFTIKADKELKKYVNGVILADTNINLCPGHYAEANTIIREKYKPKMQEIKSDCKWYAIGHNDYLYQQILYDSYEHNQAIDIVELVKLIKSVRDTSSDSNNFTRHVLMISTDIRVPIPYSVLDHDDVDPREWAHVDLHYVMGELRDNLFGENGAPFNLKKLKESLRKIRLSSPLSTYLYYLYSDYAKYFKDPFLLDSVIGLHRIFNAVYRLFTHVLPKSLPKETQQDNEFRGHLDEVDIENINELVELLHSAMAQRVHISFREVERWNVALDVRGSGLGRLLDTTDVPLKYGLRIVRKVLNKYLDDFPPEEAKAFSKIDMLDIIGGASKLTYNTRTMSKRLVIGERDNSFLMSADLNIAHLNRPSAYCIHFHETAHMMCDLLRKRGCDKSRNGECHVNHCHRASKVMCGEICNQLLVERHDDVFSEMFIHKLIFNNDHDTYIRNYLCNYSFDPISICKDKKDTFRRFLEVSIRGFLTTDPFRLDNGNNIYSKSDDSLSNDSIEKAFQRYYDLINEVGDYFLEYEDSWFDVNDQEMKEYIKLHFSKAFRDSYRPICCIWEDINDICDSLTIEEKEHREEFNQIQDQIRSGIDNGIPIARNLWEYDSFRDEEDPNGLNALLLIREVLKAHIKSIYRDDKEKGQNLIKFLPRDPVSGKPVFKLTGKTGQFMEQLIDKNHNGLFCVDPTVRSQYMKNRIATIKTFWDLSTNIRAKWFNEMLSKIK